MPAEVDTSALERFMRNLASGLHSGGDQIARRQADETASRIRSTVPRRTGRLASTVEVTPDGNGFGVTYGAGVPYADYIEHRSGAVAAGVEGADVMFEAAAAALARSEVGRA